MAKLNTKRNTSAVKTHEGGQAKIINPELQLRRSVMACLLWEGTFYEDGQTVADRIKTLVHANNPATVMKIAIQAREDMKLRHVPLLLARELARHPKLNTLTPSHMTLADLLDRIIQRADELTEFVAIYWKDGRQPLSGQVKKGLAKAFRKFDEYDLAKYNGDGAVKLRDVLFLCHAKPAGKAQAAVWKRLVNGELKTPDTWEVELSKGKGEGKLESWTRLLKQDKLGALALLRNLRNMNEAGVPEKLIKKALSEMKVERVLPFRFISAARYAPALEPELEAAMMKCLEGQEKLKGKTVLLVDISGSMNGKISDKSEVIRIDAACGLAILVRELCENVEIFVFNDNVGQVPPRRGFALRDIIKSAAGGGTMLKAALEKVKQGRTADRTIIFTDEQSADGISAPLGHGYVINVSTDKHGVGYGNWTHIDGFSESTINFIRTLEE